jgi:hypothetical protein
MHGVAQWRHLVDRAIAPPGSSHALVGGAMRTLSTVVLAADVALQLRADRAGRTAPFLGDGSRRFTGAQSGLDLDSLLQT